MFNCRYCFARDFITFSRRRTGEAFTSVAPNNPLKLSRWFKRVASQGKDYDYERSEEVAFQQRLVLKIGATSDPCPPTEKNLKVTWGVLKALHELDYPIEIQSKNPAILAGYARELGKPNWVVAVTLISTDEQFIRSCEPGAPTAATRLKAVEALAAAGVSVIIKAQPAIMPKIIDDLPTLVRTSAAAGAFALNTEGLKVRITMPLSEARLFREISSRAGIEDIRTYYKNYGKNTGSDYEMPRKAKIVYTTLAEELCRTVGIKFYTADNYMGKIGSGDECCGTSVLRNYRLWEHNWRSEAFRGPVGDALHASELDRCPVNFTRSKNNEGRTMGDMWRIALKKRATALRGFGFGSGR